VKYIVPTLQAGPRLVLGFLEGVVRVVTQDRGNWPRKASSGCGKGSSLLGSPPGPLSACRVEWETQQLCNLIILHSRVININYFLRMWFHVRGLFLNLSQPTHWALVYGDLWPACLQMKWDGDVFHFSPILFAQDVSRVLVLSCWTCDGPPTITIGLITPKIYRKGYSFLFPFWFGQSDSSELVVGSFENSLKDICIISRAVILALVRFGTRT